MADIRTVTETFAVAPQLKPGELLEAARLGFTAVINNRPDGEAEGQPSSAEMSVEARAQGLSYVHIPVRGMPNPEQIAAMNQAVEAAQGPVLAFCRSGTRSITIWALGQAKSGHLSPAALIELGGNAGYDLTGALS